MPIHRQTLTLRNELTELQRLADFVEAFCAPLRPTEEDVRSLQVVLEEVAANVINHGYRDGNPHTFTVALNFTPDNRVTAVITDDAPAFNPLVHPPVDISAPLELREVGGLGVHLVKQLTDYCHYERRNDQNVLTLERVIRCAS